MKLKKCPFCGGAPEITSVYDKKYCNEYLMVKCANCEAQTKTVRCNGDREEAEIVVSSRWNNRARRVRAK